MQHRRRRFEEFYTRFPNAKISDGTLATMSAETLKVYLVASAYAYYEQFPTDSLISKLSGVANPQRVQIAKADMVHLGLMDAEDVPPP